MNSKTDPQPNESGSMTAMRQAFCAELNHKLRTPLNAIIGFAELLSLRPGNARDAGDIQQILKSAREILQVIERELAEPARADSASGTPPPEPTLQPCDVLYVEDDDVNFALVERILEYRPAIRLMHAARGELGFELAQTQQPKMILLDLNLPDWHGSRVLRELQANRTTAHIPVVILSADATPSAIERLLTAGAKNYLTKPFDIDQFLAVVDEFVHCGRE